MLNQEVECIWPLGATLGEGPCWHAADQALYFVDIKGHAVHRCAADGSARRSWHLLGQVGFVLPLASGGLVCGLPHSLLHLDPHSGATRVLREVEPDTPNNRCNDGFADAQGRLWFGTMDDGEREHSGALYLWDGQRLRQQDSGYIITNGPCISPDGRSFYHTDTRAKCIYAYDLAPDGSLSNRRVLIRPEPPGHPDGTCIDAEGALWVAMFRGGRVDRYAPDGRLIGSIALPCPNITKLAFGGPDGRTAFITTARKGMTPEEISQAPLSGALFRVRLAVPGLPQHLLAPIA
ncbi:SMP-30/gluconolactonase/LRE family protein [Massilia sp. TS11]|uniref:SMP-30/gluconolactonase/LRE family protein n=1 Tax=Massilia sp. TS11 TaxID=2908003 RepID=UPI001ED9D82E|nr:SMP-30/gluconolactonase/LRE family protein [Massilia sp. TS11]MCG2583821.1 SMP-30/gluconolactonase/LRE family protein [Massilia sp. TS11]